jgi:hypothetical protein
MANAFFCIPRFSIMGVFPVERKRVCQSQL